MLHMQHEFVQSFGGGKTPPKEISKELGWPSICWDDSPRRSLWHSRVKRWFGCDHLLLKGLEKVRCEWSLITLAYNLKRVLKLVQFETLMAAVT